MNNESYNILPFPQRDATEPTSAASEPHVQGPAPEDNIVDFTSHRVDSDTRREITAAHQFAQAVLNSLTEQSKVDDGIHKYIVGIAARSTIYDQTPMDPLTARRTMNNLTDYIREHNLTEHLPLLFVDEANKSDDTT